MGERKHSATRCICRELVAKIRILKSSSDASQRIWSFKFFGHTVHAAQIITRDNAPSRAVFSEDPRSLQNFSRCRNSVSARNSFRALPPARLKNMRAKRCKAATPPESLEHGAPQTFWTNSERGTKNITRHAVREFGALRATNCLDKQ